MTKRMLIDATHAEETRVVVLQDQQLVDFDFESSTKKQLKGNVYLAKVTRVEPSLQAAFVEYGGNRHGFLAFSEIHPDYFQIPQADRELLAKLERESVEADAANGDARRGRGRKRRAEAAEDESDAAEGDAAEGDAAYGEARDGEADDDERPIRVREDSEEETADVMSEQARRRAKLLRSYKIQEVIKRRQIMLVQVVKEERGNKG
ncbi:MAG: S1 RNA-binding domain-containing protein, partial [Geminicoccaceae bacterium]|nr:S1 RNA-binding domain-containing protein [Geminicoccaceae bacterium]